MNETSLSPEIIAAREQMREACIKAALSMMGPTDIRTFYTSEEIVAGPVVQKLVAKIRSIP